jgi:hypothetical protein
MSMTTGLQAQDSISPATSTFDFNSAGQFQGNPGPFWISLQAWVQTPDPGATGAINFQITHKDPTGADIPSPVLQGNLILNDGTSRFNSAAEMIQRFDGASRWDLDLTLLPGSVGSALISYRVMVFPLDPSEFSPF